ncbi:SCO2322 family protein [Streptomyces sp. NPDC004647]|uniref:SCO2322 family protein n=1 Tax=Streptomyces sp. NPDC004647 TaxID=3154671 RepID=UPI0033A16044
MVMLGAGPAHAEGYRYWSFWDGDGGKWAYATQGPATARPADGDVQGFRFSVSENSQDSAKPRGTTDFDRICGHTPAKGGTKRIALVVDFGAQADAPGGETPPKGRTECARVSGDATSAEALASVAKPLRYDSNALLCAIAGYPQKGCGEQVSGDAASKSDRRDPSEGSDKSARPKSPSDAGSEGDGDGSGPSTGLVAGLAAVLALAAAALWQSRRT